MRRKYALIVLLGVAFTLYSAMLLAIEQNKQEQSKTKDSLYSQVELLADAISIIRTDYVDETNSRKLIYGAMKGMLFSLDDFSQFLEPEEFDEMKAETKGEFGGVGVEISMRDGMLCVITPIAGTPADGAGIQPGDKIVKIDGKITKNMALSEAVKKMRGEKGSAVTLTIWRESNDKVFDVQLKRDIIKVKSVKQARLLEDKIGYIRLVEFQENTAKELEEALKRLEAQGMDSLILDLRNNPGGLLDVSVDVSEKFLPKDTLIVSTKSRTPEQNLVFKSKGRTTRPPFPMVVVVNEGSASASEIVAGAIQDNRRGIIVGAKTFGKGSVQTVIPLRDGSALRLTTATYFTPSGRMIKDSGILPDVSAAREENAPKKEDDKALIFKRLEDISGQPKPKEATAEDEFDITQDNQLLRALDVMKAIKVLKANKT